MNRGPTVAQSLPVDRYAGNCLIKPSSSYYCGGGGSGLHNAQFEPPRCRYDAVVGASAAYHHSAPTPYQHYQQLQDWYGRAAYWHHHHHHQNGGVVGAVGVSGGVGVGVGGGPLAEKANFAAHKHGAPLIQAAKYNRTGSSGGGPGKKYAKKAPVEQPHCNGGKKNDGGSDESSGAASENSLPRIIKPRKRRKKERKPVPAVQPLAAATAVSAAAAPERAADRPPSPPSSVSSSTSSSPPPPPIPELGVRDAAPFDTIRLSADIKAVSLEDVSTCQCACCDPVGNVWDVGRRCFSPSLTRPEPARRSWSGEPSSPPLQSLSLQFFKTSAAVDYSKTETAVPVARSRTHSLEVSSEIVTSHNGHRDIEIKFFTMPIGHHR